MAFHERMNSITTTNCQQNNHAHSCSLWRSSEVRNELSNRNAFFLADFHAVTTATGLRISLTLLFDHMTNTNLLVDKLKETVSTVGIYVK
jgi:hypothetical protein